MYILKSYPKSKPLRKFRRKFKKFDLMIVRMLKSQMHHPGAPCSGQNRTSGTTFVDAVQRLTSTSLRAVSLRFFAKAVSVWRPQLAL